MTSTSPDGPSTPPAVSMLPNDYARWMAVAIEIAAVGAAVAFAYLHTAG